MKATLTPLTLLVLFFFQIPGNAVEIRENDSPERRGGKEDFDPQSLVGMPLEKAQNACEERKLLHRVIQIDGEPQIVTKDHRPERLNFTVEKGIVTAVTMG